MSENELKVELNQALFALIFKCHGHLIEPVLSRQRRTSIRQTIASANAGDVAEQACDTRIADLESINIKHRVMHPGMYCRIAEIMHVRKAVHMCRSVDSLPGLLQLRETVRAEAGKNKQPILAQDSTDFGKNAAAVFNPRQQLIAENHVNALIGERNRIRLCL